MENVPYTEAELRPLKVICFALPTGVILFTFLIFLVAGQNTPMPGASPLGVLRLVHAVVTAIALIAQRFLFEKALSGSLPSAAPRIGASTFLARYRTAMILKLAFFEGAALFGLVLLMIAATGVGLGSDPTLYLHLLPIFFLIGASFSCYPTIDKLAALERRYQS